ncbi:MAG TPA: PEP-CTERM sorting domain-containing protein [Phenylobacterium sp.]|jgi:hypothetical protein
MVKLGRRSGALARRRLGEAMNFKQVLVAAAMLATSAALAGPAAAALTIGDVLDLQYLFPDLGSTYEDSGSFVYTGAGQSLTIQNGITTIFLTDNQVTFSETPGCGPGCSESNADWNGPMLFDLTNGNAFSGWTVLSDTVGISGSVLTGDHIGVNWQNSVVQGATVVGSGAPEPATWAMLVLGAGLAGASLRTARRQRTVAATA